MILLITCLFLLFVLILTQIVKLRKYLSVKKRIVNEGNITTLIGNLTNICWEYVLNAFEVDTAHAEILLIFSSFAARLKPYELRLHVVLSPG